MRLRPLRGPPVRGEPSITAGGATATSFAADSFSLLALRRRSVALSLAFVGAFSLAISYIVPVAQTLAAGGTTISPIRAIATPSLEFPPLEAPAVTHNPSTVPPVVEINPYAAATSP